MHTTTSTPVIRGFTLVELLIVLVILGILAAMVVPAFGSITNDAKRAAFIGEVKIYADAAALFRAVEGRYLEDSNSGEVPEGFEAYIDPDDWVAATPLDGVWDAEFNSFGITSAIGVHFNGGFMPPESELELVDQTYDDGDLTSGTFRRLDTGRYYHIIDGTPP